jgi:hypothetical protein
MKARAETLPEEENLTPVSPTLVRDRQVKEHKQC